MIKLINILKEESNPTDIIKLDVPLFIRLLEYSKEDAKNDMDLHKVTEKCIELGKDGKALTMSNYSKIVSDDKTS